LIRTSYVDGARGSVRAEHSRSEGTLVQTDLGELLSIRRIQFQVDRRPGDVRLRHCLDVDDELLVGLFLAHQVDRIERAVAAALDP